MITDEQIKQLAVRRGFKLTNETGDDLKPYVYEFARELIALAQQVKPMIWCKNGDEYLAQCGFGVYTIKQDRDGFWDVYLDTGIAELSFITENHATPEQAIAFANEDYQRRVLSCLVWGGV